MIDDVNPTSQFHPYQPQNATPHTESESRRSGVSRALARAGISQSRIDMIGDRMKNVDVRGQLERMRGAARGNGGLVLGGLAALAIGAGLMRRRSMMATRS